MGSLITEIWVKIRFNFEIRKTLAGARFICHRISSYVSLSRVSKTSGQFGSRSWAKLKERIFLNEMNSSFIQIWGTDSFDLFVREQHIPSLYLFLIFHVSVALFFSRIHSIHYYHFSEYPTQENLTDSFIWMTVGLCSWNHCLERRLSLKAVFIKRSLFAWIMEMAGILHYCQAFVILWQ